MDSQEDPKKIADEENHPAISQDEGGSGENRDSINGRRTFLKVAITLSALLAVGGIAAVSKSITPSANLANSATATASTFPRTKVANLSDLQLNQPLGFNYPLEDEPNILVKLGTAAKGGVGPQSDIVAFSQLCQHLGCPYAFLAPGTSPSCDSSYRAPSPQGYCCCHGSVYDFLKGGAVVSGPAPRPVPQVILEVDSAGDIYATGMTPPAIFGHGTGSNDVTGDLQG